MNRNRNQYNNLRNFMEEYNITKVLDGLFISDCAVPEDIRFLVSNKIIRIISWTNRPYNNFFQEQDILEFAFDKNQTEVKLPNYEKLQEGFAFFDQIHDQMLCGLIYSETQLQAAIICIMYLMHRYHWNNNTAYTFLKNKIDIFELSDQTLQGLEQYEQQLQSKYKIKLSNLIWQYQFLASYQPENDQQCLLINTIKNKFIKNSLINQKNNHKHKNVKKIKWWDQHRPATAYSSTKNLAAANTQNKGRFISPTHCFMIPMQSQISIGPNQSQMSQSSNSKGVFNKPKNSLKENQWQQDVEYQQLKQMSRTNFNDRRYLSSKLRRRGSLKTKKDLIPKNQSTATLDNINKIVGIYSNGSTIICRPSSAKNLHNIKIGGGNTFLSGIRLINKLSLQNA